MTVVVARFAATGRIGPLYVGMPQAALGAALRGLGLPAEDRNRDGDYTDRHDSLDLSVSDGRLTLLGLDHDGELGFTLPGSLSRGLREHGSAAAVVVRRSALTRALERLGSTPVPDPSLTLAGVQSALRAESGVSLVFARPSTLDLGFADDEECLACAYQAPRPARTAGFEPT